MTIKKVEDMTEDEIREALRQVGITFEAMKTHIQQLWETLQPSIQILYESLVESGLLESEEEDK